MFMDDEKSCVVSQTLVAVIKWNSKGWVIGNSVFLSQFGEKC